MRVKYIYELRLRNLQYIFWVDKYIYIYIYVNPKNIQKITESKLGNIFHTHQLYTAKCIGTGL